MDRKHGSWYGGGGYILMYGLHVLLGVAILHPFLAMVDRKMEDIGVDTVGWRGLMVMGCAPSCNTFTMIITFTYSSCCFKKCI